MFKGFFFEYFYWRLYHRSRDGSIYKGFQAACIIAAIQGFVLLDVALMIESYFSYYPFKGFSLLGAFAGIAGLGLALYNFKKYDHKIEEFDARWDFENQDHRLIKGAIIVLTILAPFVPLIFFTKI